MVVVHRLGLVMIHLYTKFEVSMFTHYEDMKVNAKFEIRVVWGLELPQGNRQHNYSVECIRFSIQL